MSEIIFKNNSSLKSLKFDLQLAIREKNLERVKSILENANQLYLESMCFIGMSTPLGFAVYNKFDSCVQLLLEMGADPNQLSTDSIGRVEPPLCAAIRMGELNIIKLLLSHPYINLNKWDVFLQTPIYLTVRYRRSDILRLLINHKCFDLRVRQDLSSHLNPLQLAAKYVNKGRLECFTILVNIGFKVFPSVTECLMGSDNEKALRLVEMSIGRPLSMDRHFVATLKQLSRIVLRNIFVTKTSRPVIRRNIDQYFYVLPNNLLEFLVNLELIK